MEVQNKYRSPSFVKIYDAKIESMLKEKYFTDNSINEVSSAMLFKMQHVRKNSLDISSSALLVIDMQDFFLKDKSHAYIPSSNSIIKNINKLIKVFKAKNRPIVFTRHINDESNAKMMKIWWKDILTENSKFSKISSDIDTSYGVVVNKTQYDAFFKTNLEKLINEHKVLSVVIVGVMTNLCCDTTARSAFIRGYSVYFPVDATATYNRSLHEASLLNLAHGLAYVGLVDDFLN